MFFMLTSIPMGTSESANKGQSTQVKPLIPYSIYKVASKYERNPT